MGQDHKILGDALGDELWCWQELRDGQWGLIAAARISGAEPIIMMPLVSRDFTTVATAFKVLAEEHQARTGCPIRMASYKLDSFMISGKSDLPVQ